MSIKPKIIMVAAMDRNGAIGRNGTLPWSCPTDMRRFRALTTGRVILMGRVTADGLPKALRDRVNLVLTKDRTWSKPGFVPVYNQRDINKILTKYHQNELWVIGGSGLYTKYIDRCAVLHLSVLDIDVVDADAWFPVGKLSRFKGVAWVPVYDPKVSMWVLTPDPVCSPGHAGRADVVAARAWSGVR